MKYLPLILLLAIARYAASQTPKLKADESIPIPKVSFDDKGDLVLKASATSAASDFDFLVGKWKMHNRHLNKRLENCHDWTEFDSSDENSKMLAGNDDTDTYSTRAFPGQGGKLFQGLTLRLFNPKTRLWSLYWIASNTGTIDPPVVGSFEMASVISLPGILSKENRSSWSFAGTRVTRSARFGATLSLLTRARPGNGISLTSRSVLSAFSLVRSARAIGGNASI